MDEKTYNKMQDLQERLLKILHEVRDGEEEIFLIVALGSKDFNGGKPVTVASVGDLSASPFALAMSMIGACSYHDSPEDALKAGVPKRFVSFTAKVADAINAQALEDHATGIAKYTKEDLNALISNIVGDDPDMAEIRAVIEEILSDDSQDDDKPASEEESPLNADEIIRAARSMLLGLDNNE